MTFPIKQTEFEIVRIYAEGEFFTLAYIARKLGMTVRGFQKNQAKGVFPRESYRNFRFEPLFTMEQMDAIIRAYRKWKKGKIKYWEIRGYIDEHAGELKRKSKLF